MNPTSIRLLNQQLSAPQFSSPEEVVSHFGAMQAQDYRMMRWAVEMRTKRPSSRAFAEAFNGGKIVRLHLLRGTWQLVAAEDYRWMLDLCAPKARQVIKGWMHSNRIHISESELADVRSIIVGAAEKTGSVTKEDIVEALAERHISMDDHRLSYHIRFAETDGVLCSGDLHPSKATYALACDRIPQSGRIGRDEGLALLARRYFQSHQPATFEDFVWWSGLGVGDCRRGVELLGGEISHVQWQGRDFYLTEGCRTRGFRRGGYLLLPPYDEYLIGYKSRDISLPPEHKHHAHNNSGIFHPVVALDGTICGNWTPFKDDPEVNFFTDTPSTDKLQEALDRYKGFARCRQ